MKYPLCHLTAGLALGGWLLFALSGCAGNQERLQPNPQDPSRPTVASIYYYLSASLLHYGGDFVSADQLYKKAEEQDSASPQIRKQILINAAYAYLNGQMAQEAALKAFGAARQSQTFDSDMLSAAYLVYTQAKDTEGQTWAVNESIVRFPSARAYVQKFYQDYSRDGTLNKAALDKARKLAAGNADDLVLVARMFTLVDPNTAVTLLKQAINLDPRSETQTLLADITLQYASGNEIADLFNSYNYPQDKALMLSLLQQANKLHKQELVISLKKSILPTADAALLAELAFSAYLGDNDEVLTQVWKALQSRPAEPANDAKVVVFLLARALFSPALPAPTAFATQLNGVQDADDLFLYYTLHQSVAANNNPPANGPVFFSELASAATEKLPDSALLRYLKAAAAARENNDPAFNAARAELSEEFVNSGRGYESDWSAVLTAYHQKGDDQGKLNLLRQAVVHFPEDPLFMNDLGYTLLDYPDSLSEAGLLISHAVSLEPANAYYQDSMAWYYYLKGDFSAAFDHIAIPRQMENPPGEIAYHLGMILFANQDSATAREFLQKAAQDDSSPDYQIKARTALKTLE